MGLNFGQAACQHAVNLQHATILSLEDTGLKYHCYVFPMQPANTEKC